MKRDARMVLLVQDLEAKKQHRESFKGDLAPGKIIKRVRLVFSPSLPTSPLNTPTPTFPTWHSPFGNLISPLDSQMLSTGQFVIDACHGPRTLPRVEFEIQYCKPSPAVILCCPIPTLDG